MRKEEDENTMNLEGKIIDFLGDSITEGVGVDDCANNRYDNIIMKKCKLKAVYNYGIGGTRIAHQSKPSEKPRYDLCFCGRAYDLNPQADIIVVYGGVNDYIHGDAPFGKIGDTTPSTFCGGVEFLMRLLKDLYPNAKKVFMTPAHMHYDTLNDENPSNREMKRADAKPLSDYVRVIRETGKSHGIPVLDLYEKFPINPNIAEYKEKYTADGLHFNDAGHQILADTLIEFLQNEI